MLWQKRLDGGQMVYIDILENTDFDMRKCKAQVDSELQQSNRFTGPSKDDEISSKIREEGNEFYIRMRDMDAGILKYNKAILLAEADSENLGMCYANRAACFMQLKKYTLCLRDIQLAKQNGYPIRLWTKLDERKAKCSKLMQENGNKEPHCIEAKLSFSPNETNPCFVNGIEVERSENGQKRTVTERNLEIGETIIVEEPFEMVSEYPFDYHHCSNCFKSIANLIPCRKCTVAMFCSQECYDDGHEKFHNIECGINYRFLKLETLRRCVLRTIITAIRTFETIEALMAAVELFNKEKKIDKSDVAKRNYFKFFGSRRETENLSSKQELKLRKFVLSMKTILTSESILKYMFSSIKAQRFLGHLILHHFYVVNQHAFLAISFAEYTFKAEIGVFHPRLGRAFANGIALDSMHMNHSCVPNVARIFIENKIIYKVIRPIKVGEELFVSYMHPLASLNLTKIRNKLMSTDFPLKCECISCTSNFPPFKNLGNDNIDESLTELLKLLDGLPENYVKRVMSVDRVKLEQYEKSIIKHLQSKDDLHPTETTLKLQYFLMQIWGNLFSVCQSA